MAYLNNPHHSQASKEERSFARSERKNPTEAEQKLWDLIKKGVRGNQFNRKIIVGLYVVDFYCDKLAMVVNLDRTESHVDDHVRRLGYHSVRLTDSEVLNHPQYAFEVICVNTNLARFKLGRSGNAQGLANE